MRVHSVTFNDTIKQLPQSQVDFDEVILCRAGSGTLLLRGREYFVQTGDLIMIPADTLHTQIELLPDDEFLEFDSPEPQFGFLNITQDNGEFSQLFDMAYRVSKQESGLRWNNYYKGLCTALIRLLPCLNQGDRIPGNQRIRGLATLIQHHFRDPDFDLIAAVKESGYSPAYVRQVFKKMFGQSPRAYLSSMRIGYAKAQMRVAGKSKNIKQVSQMAGFKDPLYFSRVFHEQEGISPSEYLRILEQEDSAKE